MSETGGRTIFAAGGGPVEQSLIEPQTYQGDYGTGFYVTAETDPDWDGEFVQFDHAYPINTPSTDEAHEDSAFAWSPNSGATVTVKQSGLYTVQFEVDVDTVITQPADTGWWGMELVGTALADIGSQFTQPQIKKVFRQTLLRWLSAGTIKLQFIGLSTSTDLTYADLRLAPMFILDGVEPS